VRPIDFRSVPPSQTVPDDVDYPADYAPVIDTGFAVGSWEERFDAFELGLGEPVAQCPLFGFGDNSFLYGALVWAVAVVSFR